MNSNDPKECTTPDSPPNGNETSTAPAKEVSTRKIEANRKNAQRSTGPKTPEGKAKSSQNSVTHGIFVKQFLSGATPETIEEMKALTIGLREHYQPIGMMEEILMQKILVETARYGRILGLEQRELAHLVAVASRWLSRETPRSNPVKKRLRSKSRECLENIAHARRLL